MGMIRNDPKISPFFTIYRDEEWWPYVAEVVLPGNRHEHETCQMVRRLDSEYSELLSRRWQLAMHCFCGWLVRQADSGYSPCISGVEDVVRLVHNYLMPGTGTGEAVRATMEWVEKGKL